MDQIKNKIEQYIKNQEYTKAIEELTRQLNSNQQNADLYILRGDIYYLKQEYPKALNDYNKALKLNANNKTLCR